MKIVIDAMGGDLAPNEIVLGALDALREEKDFSVVLVGDVDKVNPILAAEKYDKERVELVDAKDVITNDESPTMAIKLKKESSLVKAFDFLMADEDAKGFVSAGSTGAVLVGAFMKVGRIKGVSRPALAPILPTAKGNGVVLCDCGANVDCKPVNLVHFAIMGRAYAQAMLGVEEPRIALLSNGVEDHKGNELCHEAFELLKAEKGINFVGNCEARDILSGDYDLIVSDGFNGNIALKSAEGAATTILGAIKEGVYGGGLRAKLGGLLLKPVFKNVKKRMDYNAHGGACFLGVNKVVVKSHGASKRKSIAASVLQAKSLAEHNTPENIRAAITLNAENSAPTEE
ncbi:MAG: phosphate acyltransferase PlsX [Clostridia bacterium]|nr:phosphate acyltransferase PlsX [Clostridia bacterium]